MLKGRVKLSYYRLELRLSSRISLFTCFHCVVTNKSQLPWPARPLAAVMHLEQMTQTNNNIRKHSSVNDAGDAKLHHLKLIMTLRQKRNFLITNIYIVYSAP